jgi:hypothetical protein
MYLAAGLWVVVAFLVTLYPQISRAKTTFGHYFYNVNTTFYIWYDDKAEIEAGTSTKAHGDSVGWPNLPDDQLPSLQKYLRETSPKEFLDRMAYGSKMSFKRHILPGSYGYSPYIVGYPLVALTFIILTYRDKMIRQELWQLFRQQLFTTLYILLYLSCYIVLYSFYMRISGGQRFMLALFLPLMFSTTKAMNLSIFHSRQIQVDGMKIPLISIFNLSLVPILVVHALYNVLWVVDDFYAGD